MTTSKYWTPLTIFLVVTITVGGIIAWSRYSPSQPVEISISESSQQKPLNEIYIGGTVNNPGFYPLEADDTIEALIQAAGGAITGANPDRLTLYLTEIGEEAQPQKINLNHAEPWLLKALPGIGETKAQAIIAYRHQYGPFQNTGELIKVEGIRIKTYNRIKHLITVAD